MHIIFDFLETITEWIRPHTKDIGMAQVATLLVIYGDSLNTMIKKSIAEFHVIMRFAIYVIICAFGYGALTVTASESYTHFLSDLRPEIFPFVVVGGFLFIAFLAQRVKHI